MQPEVMIIGGARTPMTDYVGALKDVSALELGAIAARGAFERSGVKPEWVDHVVVGNVLQTSADAIYGARHVALKAGVPIEVPALTVNRLCGSGIQAAVSGAQMIQLGEAGDGVDRRHREHEPGAARHPRASRRTQARSGQARGRAVGSTGRHPLRLLDGDHRRELRVQVWHLARPSRTSTRCEASSWPIVPGPMAGSPKKSCRSRSRRARASRWSSATITCGPRRRWRCSPSCRPRSRKTACVTAGNASGIVDGGAALILASREAADRHGVRPIGRLVDWAVVGVEPAYMGMGPAPATRAVLKRTGLTLDDLDLIEVNEAFAAQYLAVEKELGLDRDRVNVNGGAIALGHPLGATGTRLLLTLLLELRRRGRTRGLATACIGGGQGIAAIVEVV